MGKLKLWSLEGNRQKLDGGSMFGNVPRSLWQKWTPPDGQGRIDLACRCLLLEVSGQLILCETGIGAFFEPKLAQRYGVQDPGCHQLLENLSQLGFQPEDIDLVILSHLHFDHAGGLVTAYSASSEEPRALVFPRAKFILEKRAWDRAQNPHPRDRASFVPEIQQLLIESQRLILVEENHRPEALPESIDFFTSNGHTPGQLHTIVRGERENFVFGGDLVPGRHWVHLPITMGYDRFPEKLIDEKLQFYDRALPEAWQIFFTHDDTYCSGQITRDDRGRFQASHLRSQLLAHEI